ncbi:small ribosomal subunit protein uS9m-like [Ptychodera flava]|uniref:small ribosomal subunit protein uS9m-like n=1 Tax=Ptychodera flava TaxID=63121 RepID=UPI00396A3F63
MAASRVSACLCTISMRNGRKLGNFVILRNQSRMTYSTATSASKETTKDERAKKQGRAEMAYAAKRLAYETLINKEREEFERGKRHLANMMGEDPENFTQDDIDRAIRYLLPSGLFDKKARPIMKPPEEIFPPQKETQVDVNGRPYDFLFYTGKPTYYNLMHDTFAKLLEVQELEDKRLAQGIYKVEMDPILLKRSTWITKLDLENLVLENISEHDYARFIRLLDRIVQQPYAKHVEDYVMKFRKPIMSVSSKEAITPLQYDDDGRAYSEGTGKRKTAVASVVIKDKGSGEITVNGKDFLDFFCLMQDREQILFPFQFLNKLGEFDMDCTVEGGGSSGQSGAIRLATSNALRSFVSEETIEHMRQAGLLTLDPRKAERKKPGQKGARKKFTWKKR